MVSVCIPTFNRKELLKGAVESVVNQSYKNIEIIISDDCSTVELDDVINFFNDNRIVFFRHNKNIGFIQNWNFCIKKSNGAYIKIMGDDDLLNKNCIEDEIREITKNSVDFICSNYETIDENSKNINNKIFNASSFKILPFSGLVDKEYFMLKYFSGKIRVGLPSSITFKKNIVQQVGLFDENMGCAADIDMWIRMIDKSKLYYNDKILLKMRRHKDNLSKKIQSNFFSFQSDIDLIYKHKDKIKNNLLYKIIIFLRYSKIMMFNVFDIRFIKFKDKKKILVYFIKIFKILL
ncbi:MAG TPA: glycosyltransferase family 2 protein [Candidatus Paceibacterota bacterium]|nr:glycosyltransferase family 2 protein [Candidatus Paceibacterota bacterium]